MKNVRLIFYERFLVERSDSRFHPMTDMESWNVCRFYYINISLIRRGFCSRNIDYIFMLRYWLQSTLNYKNIAKRLFIENTVSLIIIYCLTHSPDSYCGSFNSLKSIAVPLKPVASNFRTFDQLLTQNCLFSGHIHQCCWLHVLDAVFLKVAWLLA